MHMYSLPNDVLYLIFAYCDNTTLRKLCQVCHRFRELASSDCLWVAKSRDCLVTNQISTDIQLRSCCILSPKEKCRVSLNWRRGKCRRVCLIKQRTKYMPWLQLSTNKLWVSQGERILGYRHFKSGVTSHCPQQILKGHAGDICRFVATDDFVISGGSDGSIMGWNACTGQTTFKAHHSHHGEINTIDFNTHIVVSGSRDRSAKMWTLDGALCERLQINLQDRIWSVALSPSRDTFICGTGGCDEHPLKLYDTTRYSILEKKSVYMCDQSLLCLWVDLKTKDLNFILSAQYSYTTKEEETEKLHVNGTLITMLGTNYSYGAGVLHSIYETPFGILTCGYDTFIRQWDLRSQECVKKWENPYDLAVYCMSSDHNTTFVSGSSSHGLVWLWDKRTTKPVQMHYVGSGNSSVYSVTFDPCHLYVSLDRFLYLLDFSSYEM